MALLKFLRTFVVAILVIMSSGGSLAAVAARPARLRGAGMEALHSERGSRQLAVSPWSTTRRAADRFTASKGSKPGPSGGSNSPNNPPTKKQP